MSKKFLTNFRVIVCNSLELTCIVRDIVCTGPMARGQLIWLCFPFYWPELKFKSCFKPQFVLKRKADRQWYRFWKCTLSGTPWICLILAEMGHPLSKLNDIANYVPRLYVSIHLHLNFCCIHYLGSFFDTTVSKAIKINVNDANWEAKQPRAASPSRRCSE